MILVFGFILAACPRYSDAFRLQTALALQVHAKFLDFAYMIVMSSTFTMASFSMLCRACSFLQFHLLIDGTCLPRSTPASPTEPPDDIISTYGDERIPLPSMSLLLN